MPRKSRLSIPGAVTPVMSVEKGRSPCRWVIVVRAFVENVIKESKARQLKISRFKHEGGDFTTLAQCIAKAALVSVNDLHRRHRGGPGSDARKCFLKQRPESTGQQRRQLQIVWGSIRPRSLLWFVKANSWQKKSVYKYIIGHRPNI